MGKFPKKNKITRENIVKHLVNKMLEKHGVDFDFVVANPEIEGVEWYRYYTVTEEEWKVFELWALDLIKKVLRTNMNFAKREFAMFNLNYGLKID